MHTLIILNAQGHTATTWAPENEASAEAVRRTFQEHVSKGFAAFRFVNPTLPGERITGFDPEAQEIILVPPLVGG